MQGKLSLSVTDELQMNCGQQGSSLDGSITVWTPVGGAHEETLEQTPPSSP